MRLHGVDAELLDREQVRALLPYRDFDNARFPIHGGLLQRRGGTARHDAVVWGYARAADARGVDIVAELRGDRHPHRGRRASRAWRRRAASCAPARSALACAGNSSRVAAMAGLRLPIESHVLQAFVSEGLKPLIDNVITFGAGHFYISQSDKGGLVFGGDIDGYNSYAQRGNLPVVEDVCEGGMALMPMLRPAARAAQLGRHHGHVDGRLADHRPHADRRALSQRRLVLRRLQGDAGLGLVLRPPHRPRRAASRQRPPTARPLRRGALIDEKGAGAQPNLH